MNSRIIVWIALALACLLAQAKARAENVSWTNMASGVFSNPRNWIAGPESVNRVPTAADDVSFLWPDLVVTVDGAQSSRSLVVSVPINLEVSGRYDVTELFAQTGVIFSGAGEVSVGIAKSLGGSRFTGLRTRIGLLDLPSGSVTSPGADPFRITSGAKVLSEQGKVAGKVIVDANGEWEHLGDLYETLAGGTRAPGVLVRISSGGVVRFHEVMLAQAEVEGGGRFNSGESGIVYLNVRNGGATTSDQATMPYGNAVIDGSGSGWAVGSGFRMENAFLTVTNGGLFSCGNGLITSGSEVFINGPGSRFAVGDSIVVQQTVQVLNGGGISAAAIDLGQKSGEFGFLLVSGSGSTAVAGQRLFVGDGGTGSLNILQGGRAEASGLLIAASQGGVGSLMVRDTGSAFVVTGPFGIGEQGEGRLTVDRGGRFQVNATGLLRLGGLANGNGSLSVSDADSTFDGRGIVAQIGTAGAGTLEIQDGARFLIKGLEVGRGAGSTGSVLVSSFFSAATSLEVDEDVRVGILGGGLLSVNADAGEDAKVTASSMIIGGGGSIGRVEVAGQRATTSLRADLVVGEGSDGILNLQQGGRISVGRALILGSRSGIEGTINVDGAGSLLETSSEGNGVLVGMDGLGILHLRRGGVVRAPMATIGMKLGGLVTVDDPGSVLEVAQNLFVGGIEGRPAAGTLAVTEGGLVQVGRHLCVQRDGILQLGDASINVGVAQVPPPRVLRVSDHGILGGDGTLTGIQIVVGVGGRMEAGCSIGRLKVEGSVEIQGGGTMDLEIAGPAAGVEHDIVEVSGSVSLGGTLALRFIDGYAPAQGQSFDLLRLGTNTIGSFAQVEVTGLEPGFQHQVAVENGVLRLVALNSGVAASAPRLVVRREAAKQLSVSWPASLEGFTLQHATNLLNPNWQVIVGAANPYVITSGQSQEYFRLTR